MMRSLQVFVGTANLGNARPDNDSLEAWIPLDGAAEENGQYDLIVLGMQEATFDPPSSREGSDPLIHIQVPVVSPISRLVEKTVSKGLQKGVRGVDALTANRDYTKRSSFFDIEPSEWSGGTAVLHKLLDGLLPSYRRIVSFQRGEMRLLVYSCLEGVNVVKVAAQNTGRGGLANKGGIVAELEYQQTYLSFLTAHLEAHEGEAKYWMRVNTIGDILNGTRVLHDCSLKSHYAFVMGDLNFRTNLPEGEYETEEEHKQKVRDLVAEKNWAKLNEIDELHQALREKHCLVGFQTPQCDFSPTFKVERQKGFYYIDKRRPSYTDRILWKNGHEVEPIRPLFYEPVEDFASSDHKPIRAAFVVPLNKTLKMRPTITRYNQSIRVTRRPALLRSSIAHKNSLYLFVSDIKCNLSQLGENSMRSSGRLAPSPYVLLVSYPEAVMRGKIRFWTRFKAFWTGKKHSTKNKDGTKVRTAMGWPRSTVKRNTNEPDWGNEEVQCILRTHNPDGSSIDLTGAMLRITVMDDTRIEEPVIGTVVFNLANLLRKCVGPDGESSHRSIDDNLKRSKKSSSSKSVRSSAQSSRRSSVRNLRGTMQRRASLSQSVFNIFRRSHNEEHSDNEEDDGITSASIDEPLMKNGRIVGQIQCTVEAWWMDSAVARNASTPFTKEEDSGPSLSLLSTRRQPHKRSSRSRNE